MLSCGNLLQQIQFQMQGLLQAYISGVRFQNISNVNSHFVAQKALLARNDKMEWVHAECLHKGTKPACLRCQEAIMEVEDMIEGTMGSKSGHYHTWCNPKKKRI